jgi:type I restriction enzyme R subunit
MARWKQQREETYRFAVQAFFEPTDFLRTLQHWILFYVEDGETRKSILRQHQRIAIDKIVERCEDPTKKRGLVWHTQGSGKTFTLLTAARLILEQKDRFQNATVILVVDRTELEGQLKGWVERLLGEMQQQDIPVWRAESRARVQELLTTDKRGLIMSMIHKFEGIDKDANTRENIYVFIDEAHRSVAKDLGSYMMAAVPKATIIGLTGTPIAKTDQGEGTFKIFGIDDKRGYLDKYSIRESIEDETTLPIRHTMAPSEMTIPAERLDMEFFELAESEGITDIEELNRVLERAVGLRTFLTADDRVAKVAAFIGNHFKENVEPLGLKAFVVGVNREACAKYKRALDVLLPPEWCEVVYSENPADAIERPLVAELQLSTERETDVRALFKKPKENPKILIVTDKLLTGYDAPVLYCMYLDKPMRDHVLLQAIARVNRPYVDENGVQKRVGLVVDFVGVLRELRKALKFDSEDVSGVIEDLDLLLKDLLIKLDAARRDFLDAGEVGSADERLERVVYGRFLEPEPRKAFFEAYKDIEALWEILSPSAELRDHIETFKRLAVEADADAVRGADRVQDVAQADVVEVKIERLARRGIQDRLGRRGARPLAHPHDRRLGPRGLDAFADDAIQFGDLRGSGPVARLVFAGGLVLAERGLQLILFLVLARLVQVHARGGLQRALQRDFVGRVVGRRLRGLAIRDDRLVDVAVVHVRFALAEGRARGAATGQQRQYEHGHVRPAANLKSEICNRQFPHCGWFVPVPAGSKFASMLSFGNAFRVKVSRTPYSLTPPLLRIIPPNDATQPVRSRYTDRR